MDDISKAFADITPEDFVRVTSAIDERHHNTPNEGENMFDFFVRSSVDITFRRASDSLEFNPFAVLSNSEFRRIFLADADETPEQWADRLRREADDMKATWFYVALLSPGRTYEGERTVATETTDQEIEDSLENGNLEIGLCWLALRDEASGQSNRAGMITFGPDGKPADQAEGELDPDGNPFINVLGGQRAQ